MNNLTENELKVFVVKLVSFGRKKLKELFKEGKVEFTNKHFYDFVGKEGKSTYSDLGNYHNYSRKVVWRKNHRTTNPKFSPSKYMLEQVQNEPFFNQVFSKIKSTDTFDSIAVFKTFIRTVFHEMVIGNHNYSKGFIKRHAKNIFDVLQNNSYKHTELFVLNGVWTKREIKVQLEDITFKISKPDLDDWLMMQEKHNLNFGFNSFLEIIYFSSEKNVSYYAKNIFSLLSLYKLGSVFSDFCYHYKFYVRDTNSLSSYNKHHRTYFTYEIFKRKERHLNQFLIKYSPIINFITETKTPTNKKERRKFQMTLSLRASIDRYRDVILIPTDSEEKRITTAVMGLEALYNTNDDKETIGFKLKIRTAKILSYFKFDSETVASHISKAYGIRSKYAHGNISDKKISYDFIETVVDYLRLSILIFMNIGLEKSEFIEMLNKSFYSKKVDKELMELLIRIKNELGVEL